MSRLMANEISKIQNPQFSKNPNSRVALIIRVATLSQRVLKSPSPARALTIVAGPRPGKGLQSALNTLNYNVLVLK